MSQIDMVSNILNKAGKSLHISEIITAIEQKFKEKLGRVSIVSTFLKNLVECQEALS